MSSNTARRLAQIMPEYGVRWTEAVGREMRLVTKERFFTTSAARDRFVTKLETKDGFIEVLAWSEPRKEAVGA